MSDKISKRVYHLKKCHCSNIKVVPKIPFDKFLADIQFRQKLSQDNHAQLEAACNELCSRLRDKLQLWRRFERQLEMVQSAVREADYMVELLTVQGQVDYDRLLKATEKLEVRFFNDVSCTSINPK